MTHTNNEPQGDGPSGDATEAMQHAAVNVFRIEGDYWTIAFDGHVVRLRDAKGLRYLANLLWHPGARVPALALLQSARAVSRAVDGEKDPPVADEDPSLRERARVKVSKGIKAALDRIGAVHPALAAHLLVTIRRGYACSYTPDPRAPIRWEG